jgi:hypothetical protein
MSANAWSASPPRIPSTEKRYNVPVEAQTSTLLECLRWQLASIAHAHGYKDVHELSRDDLVALTPEAAEIRAALCPEYRDRQNLRLSEAS